MHSPNRLTIDLRALVHNYKKVKALVDDNTRIMGVVKADAYGHGLVPVSQTLADNNVHFLGVAFLEEALVLRENNIQVPIVILSGIRSKQEAQAAVKHGFIPILYDTAAAEALDRAAQAQGKPIRVQIKVDTGMGRLGIAHSDIISFMGQISGYKHLVIDGLASHLACADQYEDDFTAIQIGRFKEAVASVRALGYDLPLNNLANSAGLLGHEDTFFLLARPGIILYGGRPRPDLAVSVQLKPVMHLTGHILQIRNLPAGTPISYGRTFYSSSPIKIAVISTGYADGLFRGMSNKGSVLIREKKAPLVGTICMNYTVADITDIPDATKGDPVILLGSQGEQAITGDDVAKSANTIAYEVFCTMGRANIKEYVS